MYINNDEKLIKNKKSKSTLININNFKEKIFNILHNNKNYDYDINNFKSLNELELKNNFNDFIDIHSLL